MSLSIDGVWKTGVWETTVWGAGVWFEGSAAVAQHPGAGAWAPEKKRKKKPVVVRFSDLATREERAEALAVALAEASIPLREISFDSEENEELDDELILQALTVLLH